MTKLDNGYHYSSVAIKKEFKPRLDDLLTRLKVRSLAALLTALAQNPDGATTILEPFLDEHRAKAASEQLKQVKAALAGVKAQA